jgi:hypothetical protein
MYLKVETNIAAGRCIAKKSGLYERHAKIACTKRKKAQKLSPSLAPRDTWKFLATLQKREHQNAYSMRHQSHQSFVNIYINPGKHTCLSIPQSTMQRKV